MLMDDRGGVCACRRGLGSGALQVFQHDPLWRVGVKRPRQIGEELEEISQVSLSCRAPACVRAFSAHTPRARTSPLVADTGGVPCVWNELTV